MSPTPLAERLRRQIASDGPITFAAFMEACLYDAEHGFYSRSPVGEAGAFVTSPHVSPLFGTLVARQVEEFWELLGRPEPFSIIEAGAGSGLLARQVLAALPAELAGKSDYVAVERSRAARDALEALAPERLTVASDVMQAGTNRVGCVIANELLDNLPFHRLRGTTRGNVELFVAARPASGPPPDHDFVLVEGPPSTPALLDAPPLQPGDEAVVGLQAIRFVEQAAAVLDRGYVWLCDYGWTSGTRRTDLVHGYRGQRVEADVLADPGSRDITAGVDFRALARHAAKLGLRVWGPATQRDALLALGFRRMDEEARTRQVRATTAREGVEALRIYSDRNRAAMLVDPAGLGRFLVLCLGVGVGKKPVPRSVAGSTPQRPAAGRKS